MNIAPTIVFLIFFTQILIFFVDISQTISKLLFTIFIIMIFVIYSFQKKKFRSWSFRTLNQNGAIFFIYYFFMILCGFSYGYNFEYVIVATFLVVPIFTFLIIPKNINVNMILKIVLYFAYITLFLSFLELFAWDKISFLHNYVIDSFGVDGTSRIYVDERLRLFGYFSNAVNNGLLLITGVVILIEHLFLKFRWITLISIILFIVAIYFTYTRNNYLSLFFALLLWFYIFNKQVISSKKLIMFSVVFYFSIIAMAFYLAFIEGNGSFDMIAFSGESSIQSRVISWVMIFYNYFLVDVFSLHTLFGYGLVQLSNGFEPEKTFWAIDNNLAMIYLTSGIIGVILFFSWLISAINVLSFSYLNMDMKNRSHIRIIIVLLLTYFINGAMNASVINILYLLPILIMLSKYTRKLSD